MFEEAFVGFLSSYLVVLSPFFFFLDEVRVHEGLVVGFEETFVGEEALDLFLLETMEGEDKPCLGDESSTVVVLFPDHFLLSSIVGFIHPDRVEDFQVVVLLSPDLVLKSQNRFFESQVRFFESQNRFFESQVRFLESLCLFFVAALGIAREAAKSFEVTTGGQPAPGQVDEEAVRRRSPAPRLLPYPILGHEIAIRADLFQEKFGTPFRRLILRCHRGG